MRVVMRVVVSERGAEREAKEGCEERRLGCDVNVLPRRREDATNAVGGPVAVDKLQAGRVAEQEGRVHDLNRALIES